MRTYRQAPLKLETDGERRPGDAAIDRTSFKADYKARIARAVQGYLKNHARRERREAWRERR